MNFDYSKLYGKIREICKTQEEFAKLLGISRSTLNCKLKNNSEFTQNEIDKSIQILDIPNIEISKYFFTIKVQ